MKSNRKFLQISVKNKFFSLRKYWIGKVKEHFAPQFTKEERGFTLIELLVSLTIGTALVSILLLFLNQILEVNRKEEAKSTTQQEVQAALNFIADDLQEAIYIYDSDGMEAIQSQIPYGAGSTSPVSTSLNGDTERQPVLFFWKRYFYAPNDVVIGSKLINSAPAPAVLGPFNGKVSCFTNATNCAYGTGVFTYSLVGYYLRDDGDSDWSNAARLSRWEIREGFRDPTCTGAVCSYVNADPGFKRFDLSAPGSTITDKMIAWRRNISTSDNTASPWAVGLPGFNIANTPLSVLIDFVDDTAFDTRIDDLSNTFPVSVPIRPNSSFTALAGGRFPNDDCRDIAGTGQGSQRVPGDLRARSSGGYNNAKTLSSFYACVNSPASGNPPSSVFPIARVYLRGNAAVRIADVPLVQRTFYVGSPPSGNTSSGPDYTTGTTLVPTNSILVTGRGLLNPNPN